MSMWGLRKGDIGLWIFLFLGLVNNFFLYGMCYFFLQKLIGLRIYLIIAWGLTYINVPAFLVIFFFWTWYSNWGLSQTKVPYLCKLGVFWANYHKKHPIWTKLVYWWVVNKDKNRCSEVKISKSGRHIHIIFIFKIIFCRPPRVNTIWKLKLNNLSAICAEA